MEDYLVQAIRNLKPGSEFSFTDNDYLTIKWDIIKGNAPTQKQINDEIAKIKSNEAADAVSKQAARAALLERLGIDADELKLLLG